MKFVSSVAALAAAIGFIPAALAAVPATTLHAGSNGPAVTQLQQYQHANQRADFYSGSFDGSFGPATKTGLIRWQKAAGYSATGSVTIGSRQWNQLRREAVVSRLAGYISQTASTAARQSGWAIDASKSPSVVSVLHYTGGTVQVTLSISASYGGYKADDNSVHTTYDGSFRIYAEYGAAFVSREYNNAPMPYAACFNGGQCLHYDGLFPSHGCIHSPSWSAARYIDSLPIGTTVVVHE